jgi:CheY-like chemotaxis protein
VLIVKDSADDAELLMRELQRGGYGPVFERVETTAAMQAALAQQTWDLVVSDHKRATDALELLAHVFPDHGDTPP